MIRPTAYTASDIEPSNPTGQDSPADRITLNRFHIPAKFEER
jgi:hypothetical protein